MNRCDHKTTKGTRCRREGSYYVRYHDGLEYRCSALHLREFVPCKTATGRPEEAGDHTEEDDND